MSSTDNNDEVPAIHITIPRQYYVLPGAAILTGITIGLFRGSRTASLRFLAENAHRTPKTVRGWYLYNKSKNYRVLLGGLKGAGADATKLGLTAATWVAIEEGCSRLGLDDVREVAAGLGTGALFSAVYRLPWTALRRTTILGVVIGGVLRALRWSKAYLEEKVQQARENELKAAMDEGEAQGAERVANGGDLAKGVGA